MAKRASKHLRAPRPLSSGSTGWIEHKADGGWNVHSVSATAAVKTYLCPGCHHVVRAGTAHVVVWPRNADWLTPIPVDERRHWHSSCWQRRR